MPEMIEVKSSLIASVGYDEEKGSSNSPPVGTLHVHFHKGGSYVYRGVPRKMCEAMMEDPSAGGYFIQNIKGRFECSKESNG